MIFPFPVGDPLRQARRLGRRRQRQGPGSRPGADSSRSPGWGARNRERAILPLVSRIEEHLCARKSAQTKVPQDSLISEAQTGVDCLNPDLYPKQRQRPARVYSHTECAG